MPLESQVKAAKLGMIALVDEATGYQAVRAKDELYQLYSKYLDRTESYEALQSARKKLALRYVLENACTGEKPTTDPLLEKIDKA